MENPDFDQIMQTINKNHIFNIELTECNVRCIENSIEIQA